MSSPRNQIICKNFHIHIDPKPGSVWYHDFAVLYTDIMDKQLIPKRIEIAVILNHRFILAYHRIGCVGLQWCGSQGLQCYRKGNA